MTLSMNGKANRLALGFALVLAAATFAVPRAAAQQLEGVGVRAGYGRTQLSFTVFDTDQAGAFMGGVFLPFRIDQTISIRSELLYVQKGGRVETPPRRTSPTPPSGRRNTT